MQYVLWGLVMLMVALLNVISYLNGQIAALDWATHSVAPNDVPIRVQWGRAIPQIFILALIGLLIFPHQ